MAARLRRLADGAGDSAEKLASALFGVREIFGDDLPGDPRFTEAVTANLSSSLRARCQAHRFRVQGRLACYTLSCHQRPCAGDLDVLKCRASQYRDGRDRSGHDVRQIQHCHSGAAQRSPESINTTFQGRIARLYASFCLPVSGYGSVHRCSALASRPGMTVRACHPWRGKGIHQTSD